MKTVITIEANNVQELLKRMNEIKQAIVDETYQELMDGTFKVNKSIIELDDEWMERIGSTCL